MVRFSEKQLRVLSWWLPSSPYCDCDGIICDGAVRSGKTLALSLSFVIWAMLCHSGRAFALCGKTAGSVARNILYPVSPLIPELGFTMRQMPSKGYIDIFARGRSNRFYIFGGRDEGSAALIQGVTLAGVLFDEAALMPRSFVEQALARCSVDGSRFWFSCNPEHPFHWFYREWITKTKQKNCVYLHFTMDDNPSLSPEIRRRYETMYSGAFYDRFVLGRWTAPAGAVYPNFSREGHVAPPPDDLLEWHISCDYGTVNPCSMGLWGYSPSRDRWYRAAEFYHDSRASGVQKTDEEYYQALCALGGEREIRMVVVDPSAASFIECIRRHGRYAVTPGVNSVRDGIRQVAEALRTRSIAIAPVCADTLREFALYRWNESAADDSPVKENDHAMDDIRYFVSTVLAPQNRDDFCAVSVPRMPRP